MIEYFLIGVFVAAIITWMQTIRYPWAEIIPIGVALSVVLWPLVLIAFIIQIIKDGW